MGKPLHILIVEDSGDDALLLARELGKGGYDVTSRRVETAADMKAALAEGGWDAVISDYVLPRFSGLAALEVLRESGQDLPFIVVSGNIGEDVAVSTMRAGAHDYLIKGNLKRLAAAVERELREAETRRERTRAEISLKEQSLLMEAFFRHTITPLVFLDLNFNFIRVNDAYARACGLGADDFRGRNHFEMYPSDELKGKFEQVVATKKSYHAFARPFEFPDHPEWGVSYWDLNLYPILDSAGKVDFLVFSLQDVTENKKKEDRIARLNRLYAVLSRVNETIVRVHDAQTLYKEVCRIAVENGNFRMAWIGLLDRETQSVNPVASHGDGGGYLTGIRIVAADAPEGMGPTGRAVFEGGYAVCSDMETDPRMLPWRDKALRNGFRSSAAVPLRSGPVVIGALTIYSGAPQFFTAEEVGLLTSLAEDVSFAIEAMANEELRKEAVRRTEVTNELLALFTQKFDRKSYLDAAAGVIRSWSGCTHIGIRVVDDRGNIPYDSCAGFSDEFLASEGTLSLERDACACTRVVLGAPEPQDLSAMTRAGSFCCNQTEKFVEALTDEQKARFRGVCVRSGFRSVAVIPIRYREKVLGAIHLADRREGMVPLKNVEFLEQMAFVVGEALFRFSVEQESFRLAAAVESAADAVVITEPARGTIQYVNTAFQRVTGYSREEAVGRDLHILDSGRHDETFFQELRETLRRDGVWRGRLISRKKDGTQYFEDCTFSPVRGQSGELINYVAVKRDVTERIRLESIAESVNTMDNIGYVFSGVRHEIGNPINTVKMLLSVLQMKLETAAKETVAEYLNRMVNEIDRVEHLLRSLKNFNLFETPELETVDPAAFLGKFLDLIAEDFGKKGIELTRELAPGAERMQADPRALQQVLLNIVTNAADALEGRPSPRIGFMVSKRNGRVLFQVADNGAGMTDQQQQDLFKPFYTSKRKGTGLGLVIVKKMLAKMQGDIEIASQPGRGTTVTISLPEGTDASAR